MSLPTAYTETTLSAFMLNALGLVGAVLGLTSGAGGGSFAEAINNALLQYGAATVEDATDIAKIRALARVAAWKLAKSSLAALYRFSADGGTYDRNQIHAMVTKELRDAETDALAYSPAYQVTIGELIDERDPFVYRPEDLRPLR